MKVKNKILLALLILLVVYSFSNQSFSFNRKEKPIEDSITDVAYSLKNTPHKKGGNTPSGFDSSGFVQYVYKHSTAKMDLPRTVAEQYKLGVSIDDKNDSPHMGDLVFFQTDGKPTSVGVFDPFDRFSGSGFYIVTSKGVKRQNLDSPYWKKRYLGAKRLIHPPENIKDILKKVYSLAQKGKMLDCEFSIGTTRKEIEKNWGKPDHILQYSSGTELQYSKHGINFGIDKGKVVGISSTIKKPMITNHHIRKTLGWPDWSQGVWGYQTGPFFYEVGKNTLFLEADLDGGNVGYVLGEGFPVPYFMTWEWLDNNKEK